MSQTYQTDSVLLVENAEDMKIKDRTCVNKCQDADIYFKKAKLTELHHST